MFSQPAHIDIVARTLLMAIAVTIASAVLGFPIAYYMARYATPRMKTFFYVGVLLPMWTSYLVKVYAWRLILAKQGILTWFIDALGLTPSLEALLATPVIGGPTLASSYIGMFVVFVYMWLPFMILPIHAALERVPRSLVAGFGGSWSETGPDVSARRVPARLSRRGGRVRLHVFPDAR